jgi:CsoR family transcriptional regulator, copper-sensing transcriptional repressor
MISELKKRAEHRSKIIEGQIKGLKKMIAEEKYCMDILTQSLALQRSLGSLNKLILQNHLQTCARDQLSSSDEVSQSRAINELLDLYELNNIKSNKA